ncbi:uncharacterized protein KRP23_10766 [Phytophthora ramorum]|uniref:uncharacterized protein n=1 Tax=Phytophthora ramorum TaxID=164328 RepID=UPI0030ADA950|nr:hypothetical protein KRP23_10766 [Phytophthora ramorum]
MLWQRVRLVRPLRCFSSKGGGDDVWKTSTREKNVLAALRAYKAKNGHVLVPYRFVVPSGDDIWPSMTWGYNLGSAVNYLRYKLNTDEEAFSPQFTRELVDLDFARDASQHKWDTIIMPAFRCFFEVNGHTDVPAGFVVPSDDAWPRSAWGVCLGNTTHSIRADTTYTAQLERSKEELRKLEFCFETSIAERDWSEKMLPSLEVYRQEFGHCIIEFSFEVPSSPPWPKKAWGVPLGVVVRDIRGRKTYVEQVDRDIERLKSLGFAWNRDEAVWNERIVPAIQAYAKVYKNCKIPVKFVVPSEDPWPRNAWTMKLGKILSRLRSNATFFSHVGRDAELLDELGLNLKLSVRGWTNRVVPLLEIYTRLFGEEEIPDDFVVPSEDVWPEQAWGIRLGLFVARNSHHVPHK